MLCVKIDFFFEANKNSTQIAWNWDDLIMKYSWPSADMKCELWCFEAEFTLRSRLKTLISNISIIIHFYQSTLHFMIFLTDRFHYTTDMNDWEFLRK